MTGLRLVEVAKTPLYDLADLIRDPELLRTPPVIIPHFAYQGRVTLLAAGEKIGKSTLLGQAVAANVQGSQFLGEGPATCLVLWLALDEPKGDLVRRLVRHGLRGGVQVYDEMPSFVELEAATSDTGAGLVVVDTLTESVSGIVDDPNSPTQWQPVLKGFRGIAQRTGAAIVLLHHVNKSTGRYRDSSQIGAGVDQVVEMSEVESDPTLRRVRVRGRVSSEVFNIRYVGDRYELEGAELPLDSKVRRAIESNPGIGLSKLRKAVGGNAEAVGVALKKLLDEGAIEDRGGEKARAYHTMPVSIATDHEILVSLNRQRETGDGQTSGQVVVQYPCLEPSPDRALDKAAADSVSDDRQPQTGDGQAFRQPPPVCTPYRGDAETGVVGNSRIPPCSVCGTAQRRTIHRTYRCPQCCPANVWV